jgi:uncharacterized RDD family membrane protein YckC
MENTTNNLDEAAMDVENTNILASRWSRLWASLIDALTIIPITIPLMYFTGGFDGISEGIEPSLTYTLVMGLVGISIFLIIHGKFIVRDGQTLGKKTQNIKIVTTEGLHPDISVLAKRYGFYWGVSLIPVIGQLISMVNILFIFSKSKKCIHDHVGGTKVIVVNN